MERECELRSLDEDLDPDLFSVPLRAFLSEFPPVEAMLESGVSVPGASVEERATVSNEVFAVVADVVDPCRECTDALSVGSVRSVRDPLAEDGPEPEGVSSPELCRSAPFVLVELVLGIVSARFMLVFLTALNISMGKSATPMPRLAMVPNNADAPPEIGSQGPSSVSYSRGRYLKAH